MKAILLFIETKYPVERCRDELEKLAAKLPTGSQRVLHADKTIGILIPPVYGTVQEAKVRTWSALQPFRNYRFLGLSGESECMHGSMDPIEGWMDEYRLRPLRKRPKAQHVPLTQRRQPGRQRPV